MTTRLTGVDGERIIRDSLEEGDGKVSVLQVSPEVLGKYIKIASDDPDLVDELRVLADTEVLKEVMDDFLVSSAASDLLDQGKLSLYSSSDGERRSLVVVDDSAVVSYTNLDGGVGALSSEDDDLVESVTEVFESLWETGDEFTVRTPPMSKVRETLSEEIGEGTEKDFSEILRVLDTAKGDGEGLDEITVALLAAARNKVLLYDISKWGEDSGVASKATFSRKKTEMEENGLIDTENVPIDIGRPRLRLKFADESLQNASIERIVEAAKEAME